MNNKTTKRNVLQGFALGVIRSVYMSACDQSNNVPCAINVSASMNRWVPAPRAENTRTRTFPKLPLPSTVRKLKSDDLMTSCRVVEFVIFTGSLLGSGFTCKQRTGHLTQLHRQKQNPNRTSSEDLQCNVCVFSVGMALREILCFRGTNKTTKRQLGTKKNV